MRDVQPLAEETLGIETPDVVRGEPAPHQIKDIERFMKSTPTCEEALSYKKGFKDCLKFEKANMLSRILTGKRKSACEKMVRRFENRITPFSRRAAIDANRFLIAMAMRYFREKGAPENIREFYKWLGERDVLSRTYLGSDKSFDRSERAVRDLLKKVFGIEGKPGRKNKKPEPPSTR